MSLTVIAWLAALPWLLLLLLPWRPTATRERLEADEQIAARLDEVTAVMPARNEAPYLAATLASLDDQGEGLRLIVVDDESNDGTAEIARRLQLPNLAVIEGEARPAEWNGKLWALEQGRRRVTTPYILLVDADVRLAPGLLAALLHKLETEGLDLVSLTAEPSLRGFWERLLMPAFVYFFKLVYPFALANHPRLPSIAAAAGGCILLRRELLEQLGGFGSLRSELIDDCALARRAKRLGFRTWIGLTRSALSLRRYERLADIWRMVARCAFTQLRYSSALLIALSVLFTLVFWLPLGLLAAPAPAFFLAVAALSLQALSILPTLRFYDRSPFWSIALPAVAAFFLAATWVSAIGYWRGRRAQWKGRTYTRAAV